MNNFLESKQNFIIWKKFESGNVICNKIEAKNVKARTRKGGDEVSGPAHIDDSSGVDALADAKRVE
jgi:hypothetical protein